MSLEFPINKANMKGAVTWLIEQKMGKKKRKLTIYNEGKNKIKWKKWDQVYQLLRYILMII